MRLRLKDYLFPLILILGLALRVVIYIISAGTNDVIAWQSYAQSYSQGGLGNTFSLKNNNPIFAVLLAWGSLIAGNALNLPFYLSFKFTSLLADFGNILILIKLNKRMLVTQSSVVAYLLSAPAILIACYHGNTDAICLFFIMLSLYFNLCKYDISYSAAALAFAYNIKIIPIILIPALLCFTPIKSLPRTISILVIGFIPHALAWKIAGSDYLSNVFLYSSLKEPWGINWLLWDLQLANFDLAELYFKHGSLVIVVMTLLLVATQLKFHLFSMTELFALTLSVFLLFCSGFGVQYLIYVSPFIALRTGPISLLFAIAGGIFILDLYMRNMLFVEPLLSYITHTFAYTTALYGFLTWICIAMSAYGLLKMVMLRYQSAKLQ